MNIIGNKHEFAIGYDFIEKESGGNDIITESLGKFNFWIEGNDLCSYKKDNKNIDLSINLFSIVEWFCENIEFLIKDDTFPLPVDGSNIFEKLDNSIEFDSDNDEEFKNWHDTRFKWYDIHSWFNARCGAYLANIVFQKKNENIEVAWENNNNFADYGITFLNNKGISEIAINKFKEVVLNFLDNFVINLSNKMSSPPADEKYMKVLSDFKVKISKLKEVYHE